MALVGGREIHPINVRVGGFYRAPTRRELRTLVEPLERAREAALETVRWTAGFEFPERASRLRARRALRSRARTRSSVGGRLERGLDIAVERVRRALRRGARRALERAALADCGSGASYLCGPLARFALSGDRLSPLAREAAREAGIEPPCRDAFRSIVVRSLELVYACDEALRLIEAYEEPDAPFVAVEPVAGVGLRRDGGAARAALPPLPDRRGRDDPRREDRAADVAEPTRDRGRPARRRRALLGPARRRAPGAVRAGDPQLRPLHLVRHALPRPEGGATVRVVAVGVGNPYRSDDGVGLVVAERLRDDAGGEVITCEQEPLRLLDAWVGADLVLVVDAVSSGADAGTVHRFDASRGSAAHTRLPWLDPRARGRRRDRARTDPWSASRPRARLRDRGRDVHRGRRPQPSGRRGRRAAGLSRSERRHDARAGADARRPRPRRAARGRGGRRRVSRESTCGSVRSLTSRRSTSASTSMTPRAEASPTARSLSRLSGRTSPTFMPLTSIVESVEVEI